MSVSKNGGKGHDKADVGRRKIASMAVRARGNARARARVHMHVCAYMRDACSGRFPQRNDEDEENGRGGTREKERERKREAGRKREKE